MTVARLCLNLSPDAVILVMTYLKAIEVCQARVMRGEVPGDRASDSLLNCILNELEAVFAAVP
jgi:hypothetical protein